VSDNPQTPRPTPLPVNFDQIPPQLRIRRQWVLWRYVWKNNKWDKPPFQPSGDLASSTVPWTWSTFQDVQNAYVNGQKPDAIEKRRFDGIGFVPQVNPEEELQLLLGDIDKCRDPNTGEIEPGILEDLKALDTYCEVSPSGTGVRFAVIGKVPFPDGQFGTKRGKVELYAAKHYVTITGQVLPDFPMEIMERPEEIAAFYEKHFTTTKNEPARVEPVVSLGDDEIIKIAERSRNGDKFLALWARGDIAGYPSASEADMALCNIIAHHTRDPEQIDRIFRRSRLYREKWERSDYRARTIEKALESAVEPWTTIERLIEQAKADPRVINNPETLAALADLKKTNPIEFDLFISEIKKARIGIRVDTIIKMVDEYIRLSGSQQGEPEIPPDILEEANRILDEGRAFEYVLGVWQKRHHGDENLGKGLLLSLGAQSCISSKGIHIHACGPRGSGKSDGAEKAAELIPPRYLLVGSASPKALFYMGEELPAGSVVYLDDIGWNEQAAQMFKVCTTFYRDGATHAVVVDQEFRKFKTAPRIVFWLTTTDDQTDEQIRDRLLRIDTTESAEHTREVIDFIFEQRKIGSCCLDPEKTEVCRAIIYLLKQVFLDVVIPFSENIEFDGDPRGATIFADLVSAYTIWRHRKRPRDENGALIAAYEDYKDAETFFNAIKGHGDTKYTPVELRVLQAIVDLHGEASREMIMEKTGLSKGSLSDILNGRRRDGQAKYGLLHKCPELTEEEESVQKKINEDLRKTVHRRILRLPKDYDIMRAYGKAVHLRDESGVAHRFGSSHEFATSSQDKTTLGEGRVRKFVEYDNIYKRETNEPGPLIQPERGLYLPRSEAKTDELANSWPADSDSGVRTSCEPVANLANQPSHSPTGPDRESGPGVASETEPVDSVDSVDCFPVKSPIENIIEKNFLENGPHCPHCPPSTEPPSPADLTSELERRGLKPMIPTGKRIRFEVDYMTALPGRPHEVVPAGTVVDLPAEQAERYIRRGVAKEVSA